MLPAVIRFGEVIEKRTSIKRIAIDIALHKAIPGRALNPV